jgi:hypothetical protein
VGGLEVKVFQQRVGVVGGEGERAIWRKCGVIGGEQEGATGDRNVVGSVPVTTHRTPAGSSPRTNWVFAIYGAVESYNFRFAISNSLAV